MVTIVTLNTFSGRPNPSWALSDAQEKTLTARLEALTTFSEARPSGVFGGLGYRGFQVTRHAEDPGRIDRLHVHESIVDRGLGSANYVGNPDIEHFLTETAGAAIGDDIRQHLKTAIDGAVRTKFRSLANAAATPCPQNQASDAPAYNPGAWNIPSVQPYNNCYNYANNNPTNTFAQPGRATGHQAATMSCGDVTPAAQSDGLNSVAGFGNPLSAGQGWYVALVVWPSVDYHWYRQDVVGCWSHKPGQTAVRNVDNSGQPIADPRTCDRGPYTDFCTYMVTNKGVSIS